MGKPTIFLLFILGLAGTARAQVDRTRAPQPGPAPQINIGEPDTFRLSNGLRVFVVENHQLPQVTASLLLKFGPVDEGDKVGYADMAGEILRRGTMTRTKTQLDEEIDFLGGYVHTESKGASAFSLTRNFQKIFAIMADIVLHPSFPAAELDNLKKQTLSGLAQQKDDPQSILQNVSSLLLYGKDHPYGEVETEQTVGRISLDDLKNFYQEYWKPNVGYLVLVGDITLPRAKQLASEYLGSWKAGEVPVHHFPYPKTPARTFVALVNRDASVQTNISIANTILLKPGDPENFPAILMDDILGGGSTSHLFMDLREKHGYTYGAYCSLSNDPLVGSFSAGTAVRNAVTDSAIVRMMDDLNDMRNREVSPDELERFKNSLSGNFARSLENPARIAEFARNISYYHMPKDYYRNFLKSLEAVTPAGIQQAAREFINPQHSVIVLVGKASDIAPQITQFGAIRYYDIYGNLVNAPSPASNPSSVSH
ncbi:MAG TPA: pitrilysin family protein [Chitinophagaceae bacterium]|nr:pitrilysin family protein [Chitinophagaceae bacterium]